MTRYCILLLLPVFFANANAQEGWINYYSSPDLQIDYKRVECHDQANDIHKALVVFRYINLNATPVVVSFNRALWYDGICISCENTAESRFSVDLPAKGIKEGECGLRDKAFFVLERLLNVKSKALTKFELNDIQIKNK
ncbi:MAG: hypothetical protein KatS3mg031_2235 [Chitinophagales bacterium]|nr:MAG: hypothetical protein KatS3mg031_2235 [Chitinophagales bacterium]